MIIHLRGVYCREVGTRALCEVIGCDNPRKAKGLCKFHWQRQRDGVPLDAPKGFRRTPLRSGPIPKTPAAKVLARIVRSDGCWEWPGNKTADGYGTVDDFTSAKRRRLYAHRVAYEALVGPIPDGLELDHLCRNRSCVRPDHLEPVTHGVNIQRSWASRR